MYKIGRGSPMTVYVRTDTESWGSTCFQSLHLENVLAQRDLNYIDALEEAFVDLLSYAQSIPGFHVHPETQKTLSLLKSLKTTELVEEHGAQEEAGR